METPLLRIVNVVKDYPLPKQKLFEKAPVFRALNGINLKIPRGTSFGIVGESGCGKSTLARIAMALDRPTAGEVYFEDKELFSLSSKDLHRLRRNFQMVFQDPYGSLNPRKKVLSIVAEPLDTLNEKLTTKERQERVEKTLEEVGLNRNDLEKYPHEFSGGQRQRIAIARSLITRPSLIVADESVSALDVSVQAQVLNLMMDLQEKYDLTYMFISHDLSVVEYVTDEVAVIYLGKIMEQGRTIDIFQHPLHPYTKTLLAAVPSMDPTQQRKRAVKAEGIESETPSQGCPFQPRCQIATEICIQECPQLETKGKQLAACHHV
ncbi:MAG: ATP-binding cassette domain-containing protein [Deltaproteobacteria bacterium]|jgi:oligopeptide/dipeptide ABC transporter ATP-binding protein|nr:ATP-binding cassette domain-containing protein [Deltaproteobacteria bacterium]MBT4638648.1 ATP-binding cassette domain-containing protein [Deltaproteobacteria bacterium]MBT6503489.1 ATP-binding cassette domain-containing protein [Deltaproteobacteria bacterium]MBT7152244.1 ATP-binding cassette domain-containing protein [Deltaproteobacteria bacterium]MBT7714846.1 ATP-binding cassette domain-containing protein [Deltaproteobacteria bacterium]